MVLRLSSLVLRLVVVVGFAKTTMWAGADFGDFVDPTFNCPATTTCAQVCVATVDDCPQQMRCDGNLTLCADGSCDVACDLDLESPCEFGCAPVACPKVVDLYSNCLELYGPFYDAETLCGEEETIEETTFLQFNEPAYIAAYTWICGITFLILVWCAFNQKILPVSGSQQELRVEEKEGGEKLKALQIGYKFHVVGETLHYATLITFAAWNALLCWLVIQYYALDGSEYVAKRRVVFEDEQQLLKTFIIVWTVGFAWCFALKWPLSIQSLFLRRCLLQESTHVAVFLEYSAKDDKMLHPSQAGGSKCVGFEFAKDVFDRVFGLVGSFMAFLFSDTNCYHLNKNGVYKIVRVQRDADGNRFFVFLFRRYNYSSETGHFVPGRWVVGTMIQEYLAIAKKDGGLSVQDVEDRRRVVGSNSIEMEEPIFIKVLAKEFCRPFYTYQLFMIWSWMPLYYYYMALVWTMVVLTSGITVACFHYRNLQSLFKISHVDGTAQPLRDGQFITTDQKMLVPGDLVKVESGVTYCDMVLISGTVIVDESALTGESTPQAKYSLDQLDKVAVKEAYSRKEHKRYTISAGTTILETIDAVAVITQTGSFTAKGELLREIFSFRRHSFKFDLEVPIVLGILVLYAIFGMCMVILFIEDTAVYGWFYGIYVVGTILPPLLPTVFTVSVGVSDERLAKKRIATVNSESILIAGKVKLAFFDKTGTLTKQGLDFMSTRSSENWDSPESSMSDKLMLAMATCQSLTTSKAGSLVGNPVDKAMFEASGAFILDSTGAETVVRDKDGNKATVIRHFDFDHHRMTQGVIVRQADGTHVVFVKGSGESIQKMCSQKSLPANFTASLRESAKAGIYQINVASKTIESSEVSSASRDEIERDLSFVGAINFKNTLREETPGIIKELSEGEVRSTMLTGDSVYTGIRIAEECGILRNEVIMAMTDETDNITWSNINGDGVSAPQVDVLLTGKYELAVSGKAWNVLMVEDPKAAIALAPFVRVFGRLTPQDKVAVVDMFSSLGFVTLMVGDGGNDVGALKAAAVGIALSDAEASVVAPFTSLDKSIVSVVEVLKEGRCALASALASYKFIIMYGQIETILQLINAYFQITFTEFCWVFMDGIWTVTLAMALPLARAAKTLAPSRPTASILGLQTMASVLGVLSINFIFIVIALSLLWNQDWFQCRKWSDNDVSNVLVIGDNYESEVLFLVAGYQYVSSAMSFNFGYEFRRGWFRNYVFVLLAAFYTFLQFYITLVPSKLSCIWRVNCENENVVRGVTAHEKFPIQNPFNTTVMPVDFRWKLIALMVSNAVALSMYEYFVVNGLRRRWATKKRREALQTSQPKILHDGNEKEQVDSTQSERIV